jgi:hypothetical protein
MQHTNVIWNRRAVVLKVKDGGGKARAIEDDHHSPGAVKKFDKHDDPL